MGYQPSAISYEPSATSVEKGVTMSVRALIIHSDDNVANLIGSGKKGEPVECTVEGQRETRVVTLVDDIPANHKFASADVKAGEPIVKYGLSIGRASCDIQTGQHVHVHNIESNRGRGDLGES
jgi:altronate dehydratase small subunit